MISGTTKPVVYTAQGLKDMQPIHQMMVAIRGSRKEVSDKPFAILYTEPIPPRVHTREGMETIIFCAEHGLPVAYPTGSMAGGTAPATMAGAIALGNAECLAGLVVHQLSSPGAPFIFGGNVTAMDMHSGAYTYASPEFHFSFSAFGDLAHHYKLPVWGLTGATDSKTLDAQAGDGGHFLQDDHTIGHCHEIWTPSLFNREPLEMWKVSESKDLCTSLNGQVVQVLAGHQVVEIDRGARKRINEILRCREQL